jgi:hypothetical protein
MRSHHPVSHLFVAHPAGHHHIAAVNPHPHILSRHEERITVMAILAAEFAVYPDPLAHGDPSGELHVPVAPFGMPVECLACLPEQYFDPFLCNLFG